MSVFALNSDCVVRATAAGGTVRALAAYTRATVEEARKVHGLSRTATAALGRTLSAGVMMGSMMKGERSALSIVFTGDGPLRNVTVTAKTDGSVKGYVGNPQASLPAAAGEKLKVGGIVGKGTLRIIYDVAMRDPYNGLVEIQSGEIADDLAYYFTTSDQIPSAVSLGVLLNDDGTVREAGGLIVQMMPGATDELAAELEERVAAMPQLTSLLAEGKTPEAILEMLLGDKDLNVLSSIPASFRCDCSQERTRKLLALMGVDELQSMVDEGDDVEMACAFCNKKYSFTPDELRQIIEDAN
jgi:molecular chaperone Hsp33